MKNKLLVFGKFILFLSTLFVTIVLFASTSSADAKVYRLYNPNSGEHVYTTDRTEYLHVILEGWDGEGIGWYALDSEKPVYRLYSPRGVHFYTASSNERDSLVRVGWNYEKEAFYSGGSTPIYRAYNPNNGQHNFTPDVNEHRSIVTAGWKDEEVAFYGPAGRPGASAYITWNLVRNKKLLINTTQTKWGRFFTTGIAKWNAVRPNTIFQVNDFPDGTVRVYDYHEVDHAMAWTQPDFSIKMNDYYLNANSLNDNYRLHTATHELGHALGLDHYSTKGDLMYARASENSNISAANIEQLDAAARWYQ